MPTIAEQIAAFAAQSSSPEQGNVPLERMTSYALDTLAVTLAGSTAASSAPLIKTIGDAAGVAEASIIGAGKSTSAWDAALVNGTSAHALELDDDHRTAVLHPGAVIVPAAFACAEMANATGALFLRALLVGYEVTCRLGEVFRGSQFYHGVHPTPLCGVFGAAAAAGVTLRLEPDALINALGIAGTQAAGLTEWRSDGSWIKRLHPGRAAQSGVLAARLAREGFTGPATIFEGPGGFLRVFSFGEETDVAALTRELGNEYRALGTAIKPYPCCRFAHGAIDLALEAARSGVRPSDIADVSVRLYRTDVLTYHHEPKNVVDAQFNVPYMIAVALDRGAIGLDDFTERALAEAKVLGLARRINVAEEPSYTEQYPERYPTELTLRLRNGTVRRLYNDCSSGDPAAPQYAADPGLLHREVEAKVSALLTACGFEDRVSAMTRAIAELPQASDVSAVSALLIAPSSHVRKIGSAVVGSAA